MQNESCPKSGQNVKSNVNPLARELLAAGVAPCDIQARLQQARRLSKSMHIKIRDAVHEIAVVIFEAATRGEKIGAVDHYAARCISREKKAGSPTATVRLDFSSGDGRVQGEMICAGDVLTAPALRRAGGREKEAARRLGVSRRTVRRRVAAAVATVGTQPDFFYSHSQGAGGAA